MAAIVDMYGNPLRTQQLRKQQTAHLAGLAKEFANHPAKGLTPAKLAHILIEAEQGHLQAQAELFMDMEERDAHLFAEMSKRKRAVLGLDWTIEPPRNASAAEKADAEYLHELLLDLEGIEDLMLDCMDSASATAIALSSWTGPSRDGSGCRRPSTTGHRAGFN
ncbi:phage portal protein family protein [Pseudomonas aeruginosa]|uniref:phage portal protein family protein n=1 Tax=Pseudomonas aeruginosa TaxID=287 RepID=UPI003AABFE0D